MIIGIAGLLAAGKDTLADYLVKKGFDHFSLSTILRKEAQKRGVEINRENLIELGTNLKDEQGYEVLAKRALEKIKKDTVVSSIRHPKEVEYLKKSSNLKLIEIFADSKIRYQRMLNRARETDADMSFNGFILSERRERQSGGGQEIDKVVKLADYRIDNNTSRENLYRQLDQILKKLEVNDSIEKL